ncbi:Hypothetical predicted protein [Paramuricea clavata]|uniref:Uncharacterized protein n=1 Tax=Paramuricea clavata TaxID=317549 RepID=A0A7D9I027_PARCT|nr:Hypothetical predicted protein [Paramuricea clavata]
MSDRPDFANLLQKLEELYEQEVPGHSDLDSLISSSCLSEIAQILSSKEGEMSAHSATAKLWLVYQQMIRTAWELIKADRTGSWLMHLHAISDCLPIFAAAGHSNYLKSAYLYLQSMASLQKGNLSVFRKLMNGLHVIRRSDQYWASNRASSYAVPKDCRWSHERKWNF